MLYKAKEFYYSSVIRDNAHDARLLFRSIDKLLQSETEKDYLMILQIFSLPR